MSSTAAASKVGRVSLIVLHKDKMEHACLSDEAPKCASQHGSTIAAQPHQLGCQLVLPDMLRIPVGFGVNNDILQAKILAGIHDPYGYFAAIGDENLSFQAVPH